MIGIVLGLAIVVPVAVVIVFVRVYGGHDRVDLIEMPETVEALGPTCDAIERVAASLPTEGPMKERAESLVTYSAAAHEIPTTVAGLSKDRLDSDVPTEEWAADWMILLAELDRYTDALTGGEPAYFEIPSTPDGFSILGRMNFASPLRGCDVPAAIAALDNHPPRLPPGLPTSMYSEGLGPS